MPYNLKNIRLTIASRAADIIMEEGTSDYLFAKKKAAKYLGLSEKETLPTNKQIDEAIINYQNIYREKVDHELLKKIKQETLNIMNIFKNFNPHLSGRLMDGIIPKYPKLQINLFTDNLKEVEYILLNQNISFNFNEAIISEKLSKKKSVRNIPIFKIEGQNFPIELNIYNENDVFNSKKSLMKDRGMSRKKILRIDLKPLTSSISPSQVQNK